jgi:WD repeat-containing protein 76
MDASAPTKLYLSSYDQSIRCLDFEYQRFDDIWCTDEDLTSISLGRQDSSNSTFILAADNKGYVSLIDPRVGAEAQWTYQIHEKKIGCLDVYPSASRWDAPSSISPFSSAPVFTTASNDRTCKVWDLRKVKNTQSFLYSFDHGKSCSSAYFSPNGKMIATTSYDDYVRIISFGEHALQAAAASNGTKAKAAAQAEHATDTRMIVHNNQTGKAICV